MMSTIKVAISLASACRELAPSVNPVSLILTSLTRSFYGLCWKSVHVKYCPTTGPFDLCRCLGRVLSLQQRGTCFSSPMLLDLIAYPFVALCLLSLLSSTRDVMSRSHPGTPCPARALLVTT